MRTPTGLPSASRLQLAVACPASQALPMVDSEIEVGHEGTELHDLLMRHVVGERSPDELRQEHPWLDAVLETVGDRLKGAAVEVAYGWDTATSEARLYGSRIGRHYPERPASMLVGTVDYVVTEPTQLLAVDLKSGLMEQPPVKRLQQMRFAALAVATWDGFSRPVQTAILHAPRDGRRPWWEWGPRYDSLDLIEVADTFRAMVARIGYARKDVAAGKTPRLTVGNHCTYCPARLRCPAQVELVTRWAAKPVEAQRDLKHLMDVETAGRAWAHIEAVEAAVKEAKRQLYAFAAQQPFPLPDGRMVGKHHAKGRDDVDAERAWKALVESFGVEVAKAAMTLKASRTSIREAVGAVAPRGKKKSAGDAVIATLEGAGVITQKWTEDVGPYDPDEVSSAQPALPAAPVEPPATGAPVLSSPGEQEAAP